MTTAQPSADDGIAVLQRLTDAVARLVLAEKWPSIEKALNEIQQLADEAFGIGRRQADQWYQVVEAARTIGRDEVASRLDLATWMKNRLAERDAAL